MTTSLCTKQYLRQWLYKLKICNVSDLMEHIDTFKQIIGDLVSVDLNTDNPMVLLCSLPPLLTALTCNKEKVSASLRFPNERWPEVISWEPRAFVYHNFLNMLFLKYCKTNEECEHLISLAKPSMVKSKVAYETTGVSKESSKRTSTETSIRRGHDKIVQDIEKRISEFTFIPVENGEALQVIHYEVGQKFEPHFDGFQRIATFLMYLSDVDQGGETVFPLAKGKISKGGLSVLPKKRDALLFWNMRPDGSQDPFSNHGERL
ncbi:hypothetical protein EUTSA_v10027274mg [Eutrema salsugineum]|uniref:Fe2OG dioxygenase domain-containing protein n=1 Tax=Eutrema salsugineum TaxID=72664 RepID=V4LSF7_EUTSA|nr:hypothetical protein EUTSA_v10027274mg [Eutrema salsugineum]